VIVKDLELIIHPSNVFCSSMQPSVAYFFRDIISFCGMMSEGSRGLPRTLIARGIVRHIRQWLSFMSGVMPMELSMQMST
jgi:hypothetical protein